MESTLTSETQKPMPFLKKHLWKIISGILALSVIILAVLYFLPDNKKVSDNNTNKKIVTEQNDVINDNTEIVEDSQNDIVSYLDNIEYTDDAEDGTTISIYEINTNNKLIKESITDEKKYQAEANNIPEHEYLWNYFSNIFTNVEEKNYIEKFIINTDGVEGSLASMYLNDDFVWELYVDPADVLRTGKMFDSQDFTYTLVHEFSHLLTLNEKQVNYDIYDENSCETRLISEGCLYNDSYSYAYFNEFWEGELFDEWYDASEYGSEEDLTYFYEDYSDEFVTEYASTDPDEDIAESLAHFFLTDKPKTDLIKDEKVNFFYQFPELVNMRQQIRTNILSVDSTFFNRPLIIK